MARDRPLLGCDVASTALDELAERMARLVNTTPQMTCFRGAKVCTKWLQEKR